MPHILLINSDRLDVLTVLARAPDVRLSVITKARHAHHYAGVGRVEVVPDVADPTSALAAALALRRDGGAFDGVAAPQERGLLTAGYLRSYFDLPGAGLEISLGFANKLVMKTRLAAAGVPLAAFAAPPSLAAVPATMAAAGVDWPVVVKPAVSAGTQHTYRLAGQAELDLLAGTERGRAMDDLPVPLIVEEAVPVAVELHCDGVIRDGRTVALSTSRYFRPLLDDLGGLIGSHTLAAGDPCTPALAELHQRVVRQLGLRAGVTHLEAYSTAGGGLVFGEVTIRPGGGGVTRVVRERHGVDLWAELLRAAIPGLAVPDAPAGLVGPAPIHGWVGLPARNGQVRRLTPVGELTAVDGVDDVEMIYRVGDRIYDKPSSVFNAGVAYLRTDTPARAEAAVEQLRSRYEIDIRSADPVPISVPASADATREA
jgi:hypothetical protein